MAITFAQAQMLAGDDVNRVVIDDIRQDSVLLDRITFDDAAAPTGGASLNYTYTRLKTVPTAGWRAIGSDYTESEATADQVTETLKVIGGKFSVDRVLARTGNGAAVALQVQQHTKALRAAMHAALIHGDEAADAKAFNGLDALITGSANEIDGSGLDLSKTGVATDAKAGDADDAIAEFLSALDGQEGALLLVNTAARLRIESVAKRLGYFNLSQDAFGRPVGAYGVVPIVDLGWAPGGTSPVIPVTGATGSKTTDIYAVRLGMDGFHGISGAGMPLVDTYLPNFKGGDNAPVQFGALEAVCAAALKTTKAAAVLRGVKIG